MMLKHNLKFQTFISILALTSFSSAFTPGHSYAAECGDHYLLNKQDRTRLQLVDRFKIDADQVEFTAKKAYPIIIHNHSAKNLIPDEITKMVPIVEEKSYDVIVIGGGPAGLTNSLYLTDQGKNVLMLEREEKLGGLGTGTSLNGIHAGGGAAYSAGPDGLKQYKIFQHIGLGNYKKNLSIHEPIDSYFWNGKMYLGVWEEHTLQELPKSFKLFKHVLKRLEKQGAFATEGELAFKTDEISMGEMVRKMPQTLAEWNDAESKKVLAEFLADQKVNHDAPMEDVIDLLNLYGRSALGGHADDISARQFGDFYASEMETRFTGMLGTGEVTQSILKKLKTKSKQGARPFTARTKSPITKIQNTKDGVIVTYVRDGKLYQSKAKKAVFAGPVNLAPKLIEGFDKDAADRVAVINKRPLTDYIVHTVHVKGHPFRETYDLWLKNNEYTKDSPTDMILGRWMDPKINGYQGIRNFEGNPVDDYGVITIYHPQSFRKEGQNMANDEMKEKAEFAVDKVKSWVEPYLKSKFGTEIQVEMIETFRWPGSIHQVTPGSLKETAVLAKPFGNIHFANNTLGAPELEEALERGADVAQDIIQLLGP